MLQELSRNKRASTDCWVLDAGTARLDHEHSQANKNYEKTSWISGNQNHWTTIVELTSVTSRFNMAPEGYPYILYPWKR